MTEILRRGAPVLAVDSPELTAELKPCRSRPGTADQVLVCRGCLTVMGVWGS